MLDGIATSVSSLLGLTTPRPRRRRRRARVGALAAGGAGFLGRAASAGDGPRHRRWLWVAGAILLSFWFLTAINTGFGRAPNASRYQYVGGGPAAADDCGARSGVAARAAPRWPRSWRSAPSPRSATFRTLRDAYNVLRLSTGLVRRGPRRPRHLGGPGRPGLRADRWRTRTSTSSRAIEAGPYLSAAEKFGSPAYSKDELAAAPEPARVAADKVIAAALPVSFEPGAAAGPTGPPPVVVARPGAGTASSASCVTVRPGRGGPRSSACRPGGGDPQRRARRQRRARPAALRRATPSRCRSGPADRPRLLEIPTDRSRRPWELALDASGPVTVSAASWDSFSDEAAKPGLPLCRCRRSRSSSRCATRRRSSPSSRRRLEAVADQIEGDCEFILVDDGSTDRSREVMSELRSPGRSGEAALPVAELRPPAGDLGGARLRLRRRRRDHGRRPPGPAGGGARDGPALARGLRGRPRGAQAPRGREAG